MYAAAAAVCAVADLVAAALGWEGLRALTKPLPAVLLAIGVFRSPGTPKLLAAGLLFAAAGDELLLHAGDTAFMLGMAAFAAMHATYIAAFARIGAGAGLVRRMPLLALPYAAAALAMDALLWTHAGPFAIPVTAYSLLLAGMALAALDAAGRIEDRGAAALLAGGALIFMASDTTLAFAKFWPGFPLSATAAELAIVATYFAAQIAIAAGAMRATSYGTY